jgi:formimidoylglutamate deiminase
MHAYFADAALLPTGWATDVRIEIDPRGNLSSVQADARSDDAERLAGPVLPGMPNLHSHAFQRAMAGLAEVRGAAQDDFWTWRELMYKFVARITPDAATAIARHVYIEMLKSGYTAVAEFHYVHSDEIGARYANPAEMSLAHLAAARDAGIAITMLPSLYSYGDFGRAPLSARQQRFHSDPALILRIFESVRVNAQGDPDILAGVAPHSLRATDLNVLRELLAGIDRKAPVHIHVSEQTREVEDSIAFNGRRPVEWLLENLPVDERWCLVHATHLVGSEVRDIAHSGAIVGLCPTTEGNLGDGIFKMDEYRAAGGHYGIGGDSHVSRSPFEELRLLEYVQRLLHRRRNLNVGTVSAATGTTLWLEAAAGGAQALGRRMGGLAAGRRADLVVLDGRCPDLDGRRGDTIANAAIFSGMTSPVRDVMVGGRWQVRDHRHPLQGDALRDYVRAVRELMA